MSVTNCVYLLKSLKDKKGYIGSTINLTARLKQHHSGEVISTKDRCPMALVGYREFTSIGEARIYEHKYKKSHDMLIRHIKNNLFKIVNLEYADNFIKPNNRGVV